MSKAIAVVEDDESIREMLRYYFQSVGYAVRAYESGEALFAGEEGLGLPALYILDIMLPGMDGLEILRRLREGRDTADVPVIMLTARSAEMDRVAPTALWRSSSPHWVQRTFCSRRSAPMWALWRR